MYITPLLPPSQPRVYSSNTCIQNETTTQALKELAPALSATVTVLREARNAHEYLLLMFRT